MVLHLDLRMSIAGVWDALGSSQMAHLRLDILRTLSSHRTVLPISILAALSDLSRGNGTLLLPSPYPGLLEEELPMLRYPSHIQPMPCLIFIKQNFLTSGRVRETHSNCWRGTPESQNIPTRRHNESQELLRTLEGDFL